MSTFEEASVKIAETRIITDLVDTIPSDEATDDLSKLLEDNL